MRKITAILPAKLLEDEMRNSGLGITEVLRTALEERRHKRACEALRTLRGKIQPYRSYPEIKADRE